MMRLSTMILTTNKTTMTEFSIYIENSEKRGPSYVLYVYESGMYWKKKSVSKRAIRDYLLFRLYRSTTPYGAISERGRYKRVERHEVTAENVEKFVMSKLLDDINTPKCDKKLDAKIKEAEKVKKITPKKKSDETEEERRARIAFERAEREERKYQNELAEKARESIRAKTAKVLWRMFRKGELIKQKIEYHGPIGEIKQEVLWSHQSIYAT